MRARVIAASVATLMAAATLVPATAYADTSPTTLYVDSGNASCTDSGSGTQAAPFCSIQAAADVVNPGDTVAIVGGHYAPTTITRSGTASAPIVFTFDPSAPQHRYISSNGASQPVITISGASYIEVTGLQFGADRTGLLTIDGGTANVIANDSFLGTGNQTAELHITGRATDTIVRDSSLNGGLLIDGVATGSIITTNDIFGSFANPLTVQSAVNTALTSNEVIGAFSSVSVSASPGTRIENNVFITTPNSEDEPSYGIQVDSSSATTSTADYNDICAGDFHGCAGIPYVWAGQAYDSAAALHTATGQGGHDYDSYAGTQLQEGSPLINSADSGAVGEQSTDMAGEPRTFDPTVKPTGAGPYNYYDRGIYQFQDPYTLTADSSLTLSHTKMPLGASVTASAKLADTWGDTFSSYQFVLDSNTSSPLTVTSSTPSATITPTATFSGTLGVSAELVGGSRYIPFSSADLQVVDPQPLVAQDSMSMSGPLGLSVTDAGTTDAWDITGVTFDFGDKTPTETVADGGTATHIYAEPGTYTVTETVKDSDGQTATMSSPFTTMAPPTSSTVFALGPNKTSVQEWMGAATGWVQIGGPASALYVGDAGVFAVTSDGSAIYQYHADPQTWTQVGGGGAQFAVSGDTLYGLGANHSYVARWNGGTSWTTIGGPAQAIYPAAHGVFATSPGNQAIYKYTSGSGSWAKVGGGGAQFAVSGDTLYGLGANHSYVARWNGSGTSWTTIGGSASQIYAGGLGLFAVNPGNTAIFQFDGSPNSWTRIGEGGSSFAVSDNELFGQSSPGGAVFEYTGVPNSWTNIGDNVASIVGG